MNRTRRHLLAAGLALGGPARLLAAPGGLPTNVVHGAGSPQWNLLRGKLFGERPIAGAPSAEGEPATGSPSLVKLIVPLRAAYGASVPIKIVSALPQTAARFVQRLTLLVDKNPSPVAATLQLTPALGQADFETRIRVDEYSHVRVITELNTGELHMDSRYVKVSGGCSAPPNRESPHLIGKTVMRLPDGLHLGAPTPVDLTVLHPNDTGFELNQVTVMFIPPHFVRSVRVRYGSELLFDAETDFSISENPSWRFYFVPRNPGLLTAEVEDTKEQHFKGTLDPFASGGPVA